MASDLNNGSVNGVLEDSNLIISLWITDGSSPQDSPLLTPASSLNSEGNKSEKELVCKTCGRPHKTIEAIESPCFIIRAQKSISIKCEKAMCRSLQAAGVERERSLASHCAHEAFKLVDSILVEQDPEVVQLSQKDFEASCNSGGLELNSGLSLSRHQAAKICLFAKCEPDYMFMLPDSPNRLGQSQWHSTTCIIGLASGQLLLREENRITIDPGKWNVSIHQIKFCVHQDNQIASGQDMGPRVMGFEFACLQDNTKRDLRKELVYQCRECCTELCIMKIRRGEKRQLIVWRYMNLGNFNNPNEQQWRRILGDGTTKQVPPASVVRGYGPIMEEWCQRLGIRYHFDRRAVGFLVREEGILKEKSML